MTFSTLLQATTLIERLHDPDWLLVDCRFELTRPEAGELAWSKGHIPGALYAHLEEDLSGPVTPESGRHPLPAPERFAQTLSRWGITPRTQVITYDASSGVFAARLWWMLRWLGHDAVAVLDGGLQAWLSAGGGMDVSPPVRAPSEFVGRLRPGMTVSTAELASLLDRDACRLVGTGQPAGPRRLPAGGRPRTRALRGTRRAAGSGGRPRARRREPSDQPQPGPGRSPAVARSTRQPVVGDAGRPPGQRCRLHVRIRRHGLPRPAGAGAGGTGRRPPVCRLLERMDPRSRASRRAGTCLRP